MSGAMMATLGNWKPAAASSVGLVLNLDAAIGALPGSAITTSANFNATPTQWLSVPNNAGFAQNQPFTIECWFYPTNLTGGYVWAMLQPNFLNVTYRNSGKFVIDQSYVGNPPGYSTLDTTYPINNWYHIALSWTGTNGYLFINGAQESTFTGAGATVGDGNPFYIAQYQGQGQPTPQGNISNFRVVQGTALYTAPFTPPTNTLLPISGTQLLLPLAATPFTDLSNNALTVTNNGSVATSANVPSLTVPNTDLLGTSVTKYNPNSSMAWTTATGGIFQKTSTNTADFLTFGPDYSVTSQAYTVMMVYRSGSTAGRLLNANTASPDWLMGLWDSPANVQDIFYNGGFIGSSSTAATGTWQLQWVTYNGTPASAVSNSYVATSSQPTTTFGTGSTNGGFNSLRLFGRYASATTISEVGVYDTALVKVWNGVLTLSQIQAQYAIYKARFGY